MSARPRDEHWEALCTLFGPAQTDGTRGVYNKVASDLRKAHYSEAQVLRAGKLYQRDHKDWAFTPAALLKNIDRLLHVDRSMPTGRPATSTVSVEDDRPGISLMEYAMSDAGKQDPHLSEPVKDILRRVWKRDIAPKT